MLPPKEANQSILHNHYLLNLNFSSGNFQGGILVSESLPLPIIHIFSTAQSQNLATQLKLSLMVKIWVANLETWALMKAFINQI